MTVLRGGNDGALSSGVSLGNGTGSFKLVAVVGVFTEPLVANDDFPAIKTTSSSPLNGVDVGKGTGGLVVQGGGGSGSFLFDPALSSVGVTTVTNPLDDFELFLCKLVERFIKGGCAVVFAKVASTGLPLSASSRGEPTEGLPGSCFDDFFGKLGDRFSNNGGCDLEPVSSRGEPLEEGVF